MAIRKNTIPELTESDRKRFMSKIDVGSGCWNWTGATTRTNQYGRFSLSGKCFGPHCVSWTIFRGPIPVGYLVRHSCDNQKCVNPDHMSLGLDVDNKKDSIMRGRAKFYNGSNMVSSPKLNSEQWGIIRKLYPSNSQTKIAKMLKISQSVVSRVINMKRGYSG